MGFIRRIGRRVVRTWVGSSPPERDAPKPAQDAERSVEPPVSLPEVDVSARRAVASRLVSSEDVFEAIYGAGKVRIVNHWATWCSGCVEELPLLLELSQKLGPDVEILGVSWDGFQALGPRSEWVEAVEQCSLEHGLTWGSLVVDGEPEDFFERLGMECQVIPQVWVVNEAGGVVHRVEQPIDRELLDQILSWVDEL